MEGYGGLAIRINKSKPGPLALCITNFLSFHLLYTFRQVESFLFILPANAIMKFFVFLVFHSFSYCLIAQQKIDLLLYNTTIYTVDDSFLVKEAMAVDKGKIIETGTSNALLKKYLAAGKIDARGKFVYPGLIDAHAHFVNYGRSLQRADLRGTDSWNEVLERLTAFAATNPDGWLQGEGWDQNDWKEREFPTNRKLNELFPERPVVLSRIDGHAIIANDVALQKAGINAGDKIDGGEIEVSGDKLTGILVDNATGLVTSKIPPLSESLLISALIKAQKNCFASGLTTIDDCGLDYRMAFFIDSLQKEKLLKMKLFIMLSDVKSNYEFLFSHGKIKTGRLNVSSFKVYADGALGSRGACLLQPYNDRTGWNGFLLNSQEHMDSVANILASKGLQMCTHAIGDSGNRVVLNIYSKYLKGKNDRRWRIEHAQVINKNDFHLFGAFNIIPSVQPLHATSDMPWAGDRLGSDRLQYSYAFNDLKKENGWIALGTDFPVEDISPLKTFYAAIARKDENGFPGAGFQRENALSRQDALRGMTIWAAKSNFEENEKGTLEAGKFADFIIADQDLLQVSENKILKTQIIMTFINGEKVFEKPD
ncbi:amidohydrolase [soil metagenome]